jgi:hypothetical protein
LRNREELLNREFVAKLKEISDSGDHVFSIGHNTFFTHDGNRTTVRHVTENGTVELELGTIEELCEGNVPFESTDDDWTDMYLPLVMAVESGINRAHASDPELKDKMVITILQRLIMRPDINLNHPVAIAVQDNLELTLATNAFSKKEVIGSLKKVLPSVTRHHAVDGSKGYLNFIKDKV